MNPDEGAALWDLTVVLHVRHLVKSEIATIRSVSQVSVLVRVCEVGVQELSRGTC